jgi:hypothetical protein
MQRIYSEELHESIIFTACYKSAQTRKAHLVPEIADMVRKNCYSD